MSQKYKIVFSGVTLFGFDAKQLRKDSQQLLALDDEELEHIFSGELITLRNNLSLEDGRRLEKSLKDIGLFIYLEEDNPVVKKGRINLALRQKVLKRTHQPKRIDDGVSVMQARSRHNLEVNVDAPSFFSLSFTGRYGRLNYLNIFWLIHIITMITAIGMIPLNMASLYFAIFLIAIFLSIRAAALRLHDLNKSAWHSLLLFGGFIPYVGVVIYLAFTVYLMLARGTIGDNDYGMPSKRGNMIGLMMTCAFPILLTVILLLYGLPAYQDYNQRLQVTDGMQLADDAKKLVIDYYTIHKNWPNSNYDIGLSSRRSIGEKNIIDDIQVTYGGKITIYYGEMFNGGTIILKPTINDGQYVWDCYGGTVPPKYRPQACRR